MFVYFQFQPLITSASFIKAHRRNSFSLASQSNRFEQLPNNITIPVQFRTENWQLRTENCFSAPSKFYGQAERAISTGKLHASLRFHIPPINQVVFLGPSYPLRVGRSHLEECFPLICIQRLSQPNFATERCPWQDSSITRGSSIPVLSY